MWGQWRPMLCDPARRISSGWWYPEDQASLADLLACLLPAFRDPDKGQALRLQMQYAITAIADRGFVEQRIMSGAAGLEHMMWQELVLSGRLTEAEYRAWPAHKKLRSLLTDARIELDMGVYEVPSPGGCRLRGRTAGERRTGGGWRRRCHTSPQPSCTSQGSARARLRGQRAGHRDLASDPPVPGTSGAPLNRLPRLLPRPLPDQQVGRRDRARTCCGVSPLLVPGSGHRHYAPALFRSWRPEHVSGPSCGAAGAS